MAPPADNEDGLPLLAMHPGGALRHAAGLYETVVAALLWHCAGVAFMVPSSPLPNRRHCRCPTTAAWLSAARTRRSHLLLNHEDPSVAERFSVSRLRRARGSNAGPVPSAVHGAPLVRAAAWAAAARLRCLHASCRTPCRSPPLAAPRTLLPALAAGRGGKPGDAGAAEAHGRL